MNIWQILGISPTTNVSIIKKVFAEKSKKYHPEEHPEEFSRLRDAYKQALRYAKEIDERKNYYGEEESKKDNKESKYISFVFGKSSNYEKQDADKSKTDLKKDNSETKSQTKTIKDEDHVDNFKQNNTTEEPRKTLYERMHGVKMETVQKEATPQPPKSLYERIHGDKPKVTQEEATPQKPKSLFERMHGESPKVIDNNAEQSPKKVYEEIHSEKTQTESNDESDDGTFNYEVVYDNKAAEEFIYEMEMIFNNPFLRNNGAFWDYYMNKKWNGDFMRSEYVVNHLINKMCKYQGWFEIIIEKLERYFNASLDKVRNSNVKMTAMATQYENDYHQYIMSQISRKGFSKSLDNEESIMWYLNIYFNLVRNRKIKMI